MGSQPGQGGNAYYELHICVSYQAFTLPQLSVPASETRYQNSIPAARSGPRAWVVPEEGVLKNAAPPFDRQKHNVTLHDGGPDVILTDAHSKRQ